MFERFTDRSKRVMNLADEIAKKYNHEGVGVEHVLLGLVNMGHGGAVRILKGMGIKMGTIRSGIENNLKVGRDMVVMGKLPQRPEVEEMITKAVSFAVESDHDYVGTEHIVYGILEKEGELASDVLRSLGVTSGEYKSRFEEILETQKRDGLERNGPSELDRAIGDLETTIGFDSSMYGELISAAQSDNPDRELAGVVTRYSREPYAGDVALKAKTFLAVRNHLGKRD